MSLTKTSKKRLDKVDEIAIHHGFELAQVPTIYVREDHFLAPREKEYVVKIFNKSLNNSRSKRLEPRMFYYDQQVLVNKNKSFSARNYKNIGLDIFGVPSGIAEVMIINTATKILREEGYKDIFIDINCTGDKNSISKFTDELINYYKKNSDILKDGCGGNLNRKEVSILNCGHENCRSLKENAPRPINFLSEHSQQHLKEVLEYLEEMDVPYRINDDLISDNNHYSKTIFEIKSEQRESGSKEIKEIILARGGRYDEVANKVAKKRNLVAVGVSLQFKKNGTNKAYSDTIQKPKIFLIQFGFRAKLKSLEIVDILREQQITVYKDLHRNKLTDQFYIAKKMGIPYILIIGQKEAMEDEVIIKNVVDASQDVVKIDKISQYFKKIKFV